MTACHLAKQVFAGQSSCVELEPPVVVCGDIHGQASDIIELPYTEHSLLYGEYYLFYTNTIA